jgi:hypothetical protein
MHVVPSLTLSFESPEQCSVTPQEKPMRTDSRIVSHPDVGPKRPSGRRVAFDPAVGIPFTTFVKLNLPLFQ